MRCWSKVGFVAFLLVAIAFVSLSADSIDGFEIKPLDEFINHYEPVVFQTHSEFPTLLAQNTDLGSKTKKGALTTERVEIRAFGRTFNLLLTRTSKILAPNAVISVLATTSGCIPQQIRTEDFLAHLVEGEVCDETDSFVHGTWRAGVFSGAIHIKNNTYFVERATKYFRDKVPFDAVMFRMQDLNMTAFDCMGNDGEEVGQCDPIQLPQKVGPKSLEVKPVDEGPLQEISPMPTPHLLWFNRERKNTCHLKLVADHLFYQNAGDGFLYNAVFEMIFHVSEANQIFRATDFDEDGTPDQVGFQVEALDIIASPECASYPPSSKSAVTSDQYLEQFSEHDLQNYCVGVAFSGYTFPGRVLGIAWMADSESGGYVGGICEPRLFSTHDQKALSFNSAVITIMLEGRRVPRGITAIAVAHELGHSFGSDHDPYQDPICSPSKEEGGKYIMAAYAVKGDRPNNRYFSPCSKRSMSMVLNKKSSCFGISNSISADLKDTDSVDNEEHYFSSTKSMQETEEVIGEEDEDIPNDCYECNFEDFEDHMTHECSCSPTCNVIHSATKRPIVPNPEDANDCVYPSEICDTDPSLCPPTEYRPDGATCHDGHGVCQQGACVLEEEALIEGEDSEEHQCVICCNGGDPEFNDEDESIDATCIPLKRSEHPWVFNKNKEAKYKCSHQVKCDIQGRCGRPVPKPEDRTTEPTEKSSPEQEQAENAQEYEGHGTIGDEMDQPQKKIPDEESVIHALEENSAGLPDMSVPSADIPEVLSDQELQTPVDKKKDESDGKEKLAKEIPAGPCDLAHMENCVMWIAPGILIVLVLAVLFYVVLLPVLEGTGEKVSRDSPRDQHRPARSASIANPVFYRLSRNVASLDLACRSGEQHSAPTSNQIDQIRSKSL